MQSELTALSDDVWGRLRRRLEGLTDDEYTWEPAPGCWTIHQRPDGSWTHDSASPAPDPGPFTTLAWRVWHLIDMYGEDRAPLWLGVPPQGQAIGLDDPDRPGPPPSAAAAVKLLEKAHDRWDAHLALATDDVLAQPCGRVAGRYAERTRTAYVLHMLDEFVHHGAEVSLLRDLWRWQHPLGDDDLAEQAMRGDMALLDALSGADLAGRADLVDKAAEFARWELLLALLERGAPLPGSGRTPLHLAAGAGELAVVQALLDRGANPAATDPTFGATPAQWARFLDQPEVAALLDGARAEG
jgi:hypothetical protein